MSIAWLDAHEGYQRSNALRRAHCPRPLGDAANWYLALNPDPALPSQFLAAPEKAYAISSGRRKSSHNWLNSSPSKNPFIAPATKIITLPTVPARTSLADTTEPLAKLLHSSRSENSMTPKLPNPAALSVFAAKESPASVAKYHRKPHTPLRRME